MTIGELLGGPLRLRVPGYQRPYAWLPQQAGQLLDDILLAIDDPSSNPASGDANDYFLGAIVLMEKENDSDDDAWLAAGEAATHEIVDGLQRLVTITILLAVLRDIADDVTTDDAQLAGGCIAATGGTTEAPHHRPLLRLRLSGDTHDFFYEFVQQPGASSAMPSDDDLPAPETRLLAVREYLMSSLIGETGERRHQILRHLLDHCHFAVISARTLDRAHQIFAVLNDRGLPLARGDILKAQILGAVPAEHREPLNARWRDTEHRLGGSFEEFFSHLRTIEGRSRARILDEIRALVDRSGDPEAFVEHTLFPFAEILCAIRAAPAGTSSLPVGVWAPLRYLSWLGSHDWVPPLMLYWRGVDGRIDQLQTFLLRLERLAFGLRVLGIGSDKRATRYRTIIDAIRSGRIDDTPSPLDLSRDEQRLIAFNLRALHARSQLACKLVLLRLNDLLAGKPQGLDPANFTVEHILPQKPARQSRWREWFPNPDERERCTQSIGNLILVSRTDNEQARNLELDRKLAVYFRDGTENQPPLTREIDGATEWRPDDVKRREDHLLALLNAHWQIGGPRADATESVAIQSPTARGRKNGSAPGHRQIDAAE